MMPEVCIILSLMNADPSKYVPIIFDEAGRPKLPLVACGF